MSSLRALALCLAALTAAAACDSPTEQTGTVEPGSLEAFAQNQGPEHADVMNQGGIGVYAADGSALVRQPNGLRISMKVPTPEAGTYTYPDGAVEGPPEVFTLWAFIFNHPENCTDPCNGDDLGDATGAFGGAYNVGGHITGGGGHMNIAGRIGVGEEPRAFAPLELPATAEVHVALAPHGAMDPTTLPGELSQPAGSPICDCWWVAIFK